MSAIKLLKLNWTPESIPTAWVLRSRKRSREVTEAEKGQLRSNFDYYENQANKPQNDCLSRSLEVKNLDINF